MYTVCLVEDDPNSQELFVQRMRECKGLKLAGVYSNGPEALQQLPTVRPRVILMDIKMPGMSGIQCLAALRQLSPPLPSSVLMVTDYDEENLIFESFRAGASGYLLKEDAYGKKLEAAIADALEGGRPMSRSVIRKVTAAFAEASDLLLLAEAVLTLREWEALDFLTQGLAYKQIAASMAISECTVHQHLRNLYDKLRVQTRTDPRLYSLIRQHKLHLGLPPH